MWFWASAICVTYVFTFWHVGCFCEHVEMLGCTMMQPLPLKKGCQACSRNQFSILEVMNLSFHSGWSPGDTNILRCFWCIFTSLHMSCIHMFHSKKRCQCGLHPQIQDSLWSPFPTSNSGPSGPQLLHNILGDLENPKKRRVKKARAGTLLAGSHRNHRIFGAEVLVNHTALRYSLVGGLEHFLFSHLLGIIIPID